MGSIGKPNESLNASTLPIIDFKPWVDNCSREERLRVARDLVEACHNTGFCYIRNHGISEAIVAEAFAWSKKFYSLEDEEKAQAAHPPGSDLFRGYSKIGHETIPPSEDGEKREGVIDYNESYGMGSDNNKDQPNIWIPESTLPGFQEFVKNFYAKCWETSQLVLRALALGLGLEDEAFLLKFHNEKENELSFRHYPSISESKVKSGEVDRLGAHTDFDSFTLLWQDSFGGLTVKDPKSKQWVDTLPIEGALVMNIGDVLGRWSNDYLVSTLHRVHLPPMDDSYVSDGTDRKTRDRFSIPYFVLPESNTLMECLEVCCNEDNPKKYEPMLFSELYRQKIQGFFSDHDAK